MNRIGLFILLFTLVSCGIGDPMGPLNFSVHRDEPIRAEEVNFAVLKAKVLPKCIGCHKDWTSEEIVNRFTRENLPDQSRLFTTVKSGAMPKNAPALNSALLEITRNYVQNIRYVRPVEEALPDDDQPVSFDVVNEKVFKISCLPCHSQRSLKDAESLANSKWINRQNLEESKLLTSVVSGKMPKERNLLTQNQIELIRRYLRNFRTR
jgi:hypothetical protein